jgi:hypothetical protein
VKDHGTLSGLEQRYELLAGLTAQVARAAAELQAARLHSAELPSAQATELDELTERLQVLQLLLANETERAWSSVEAAARRTRRAEILGFLHDATSAETTLPAGDDVNAWPGLEFGPSDRPQQDRDEA